MPYIKENRKDDLALGSSIMSVGELNYKITIQLVDYMNVKGLSYQTINDIMGALEGAKAEFYRRIAVPYEDNKIKENGDVY